MASKQLFIDMLGVEDIRLNNVKFHYYFSLSLLCTFNFYLFTMYFCLGSISLHRYIFYVGTVLPFTLLLARKPDFVSLLAKSKIIQITLILILLAISSIFYTGNYNNLLESFFDAFRYGFLILILLSFVIYLSLFNKNYLVSIVSVLAVGSALSAVYFTSMYFYDIGAISIDKRMMGGIEYADHPIQMSEMYAVGVLSAISLLSYSSRWFYKLLFVTCFIASLTPMILSQSRAPLLAVILAISASLSFQRYWKILLCFIGFLVALLSLFLIFNVEYRDITNLRTFWLRVEIWKIALHDISQNLFTGLGWLDLSRLSECLNEGRGPCKSHNIYLTVMLEGGIFGFIVFSILLGYGLLIGIRSVNFGPEYAAAFSILVFYSINGLSMMRWIYENPGLSWLQFWLPLSLLAASEMHSRFTLNKYNIL